MKRINIVFRSLAIATGICLMTGCSNDDNGLMNLGFYVVDIPTTSEFDLNDAEADIFAEINELGINTLRKVINQKGTKNNTSIRSMGQT